MVKRIVYIASFTILGILLSFLVHAAIEIPVINLLLADFDTYGMGLTWRQWETVHNVGTVVLLALGIIAGYMQGVYWWNIIYVRRKYKK